MNLFKYLINLGFLGLLGLSVLVGCSPVGFNVSQKSCENTDAESCIVEPNASVKTLQDSFTVKEPIVDILFVVDNSTSMATEQQRMGQSFTNFISRLNNFNIDWQLGITTSDISSDKRKEIGDREFLNYPESIYSSRFDAAYQDGNLLSFSSGETILKKVDSNAASLFESTVQIEQQGTWDERGIFAASLALQKNQMSLFRPESSHTAIVILSDEDVRSIGTKSLTAPYNGFASIKYQDQKEYLASVWKKVGKDKGISVHSIIIREEDSFCYDSQNSQPLDTAEYGRMYQDLSQDPRFEGVVGSVCAPSYANQLADMGSFIADRTLEEVVIENCNYITDGSYPFTITVNKGAEKYIFELGDSIPSNTGIEEVLLKPGRLIFDPALEAGTTVTANFSCNI